MAKPPVVVKKKVFRASDKEVLSQCLAYIDEELKKLKISKKLAIRSELISEEIISEFIRHGAEGGSIAVSVKHVIGDTSITINSEGEEFDPYGYIGLELGTDDETTVDSQDTIRSILLKSMGDKLKYTHRNGINSAKIIVGQAEKSMLVNTVIALVLGVVFGLLIKFVIPQSVSHYVTDYGLDTVKTLFMNAIRIIVGPVVFFSIVSCISQFKSLSELGKIGAKVMGTYLVTTVIAVCLSFAMVLTIKPGEFGFALGAAGGAEVSVAAYDNSIKTMITGIVPSNFFAPFVESNTMQLIFLAVITGIAVGMVGKHSKLLRDLFEALNSLFLAITSIITRFTPVAVFASISLLFADIDSSTLTSVLSFFLVFLGSILIMMCIYGVMVLLFGRLNPLRFYYNAREGLITSFTLASSSAAMPTNLKVCTDKLGVSSKVANFAIPLGATINMDGGCIFLTVTGIFLARAYGVEIPLSALISLGITIILLSLSAPGIPGAGIVNIGIVLTAIGVPLEAITIILGIYPILDMFITVNNITGDIATSAVVAKSEKLLDTDVYYRKETVTGG